MANPWAGEVTLQVNGVPVVLKLTLGALAGLEARLGADSLVGLIERFEGGAYRTADLLALIHAGLQGGGWHGTEAELAQAEIAGGFAYAAAVAARALALAFAPPEGA
ncbi:gene transfer agent family protein [Donghicola sp. C2-DW-16]|uniref:Gene transfer agent family protein n=2 Tax=Donghicola mangrovi TaxID=2729614 RepID=A0ABX2PFS1_9RHOB|nr:gene transfer agent family protein [Donghicola mangrovi]NVO27771.1 gene transfer agent family protein [Donghicola mangrovi]